MKKLFISPTLHQIIVLIDYQHKPERCSFNSHFFEKISVRDGLQFLKDEVDTGTNEEALEALERGVEQPDVAVTHGRHHVYKLLQVVLDQQRLLRDVALITPQMHANVI